jgi:NADH:ubiquinone oxidoreductase subunit D
MYVLAVEALCVVHISYKSSQLRVIMSEVTRIFNTLLAGSCAIFDLGSLSLLLWSCEKCEKFMSVFEWGIEVIMHCSVYVYWWYFRRFTYNKHRFLL